MPKEPRPNHLCLRCLQDADRQEQQADADEAGMTFDELLQAQIARGKKKASLKGGGGQEWAVGFNVMSPEEAEKRARRAERFGESGLKSQQEQRQERFGLVEPVALPTGVSLPAARLHCWAGGRRLPASSSLRTCVC